CAAPRPQRTASTERRQLLAYRVTKVCAGLAMSRGRRLVFERPPAARATLIGKNDVTARSNLSRIATLLAVSLACGPLEARAESMDALYEKAKLEKTVVLYGAGPTGSHDRWIKDFEQRFPGVTVALTGGLSTSLNQRIERQLASGTMETDLAILQTIQD